MTDAVFLVGFMGSGKSVVGRELAERLNWSFVDLDEEISKTAGRTIPEIFDAEGEEGFRFRERKILEKYLTATQTVISCGGGILTQAANLADLTSHPGTVCLQVSPEEVWRRVGQDANRPLLQSDSPAQTLRDLFAERAPFYGNIPIQIPTEGFRPSEVVDRILSELR